jgi:hypothetical protein
MSSDLPVRLSAPEGGKPQWDVLSISSTAAGVPRGKEKGGSIHYCGKGAVMSSKNAVGFVIAFALVFLLCGESLAQDPGVADTVRLGHI